MNNAQQLAMAGILIEEFKKQAGFGDTALNAGKSIANQASYFVPGLGTAHMGYDSYNAFREGRPWAGIGSALGAVASAIPAGGMAARGIGMGLKSLGGMRMFQGLGKAAPMLKPVGNALAEGWHGYSQGVNQGLRSAWSNTPVLSRMYHSGIGQKLQGSPGLLSSGSLGLSMASGLGTKPVATTNSSSFHVE